MRQIIKRADQIIAGNFIFDRTWDMEAEFRMVKNQPLDWQLVPFADPEWNYVLNRMDFLIDVAVAYRQTGDEKYRKSVINLIEHWIDNNLDRLEVHRTIDTGIRLLNWYEALDFINEEYTDKMKAAVNEQVRMLKSNYRLKDDLSNWGIFQAIGVIVNKDVIENHQLLDFWQEKLKLQLELQINEEGFHWENSIMYQNQIILSLCRLYRLNQEIDLSEQIKTLVKTAEVLMKNNYQQIMQNDSDDTNMSGLLAFASELIDDIDLGRKDNDDISKIYCQTETNQAILPITKCYRKTGLFVKRVNGMYLSMHNHAYGSSHTHIMPCHINYTLKEDILIDPGRYSYQDIDERYQLKSITSHNSPIMKNVIKEEIINAWDTSTNIKRYQIDYEQSDELLYCKASYLCDGQLIQRRLFEIDSNIIVIDQYPSSAVKEVNLVLGPKICISQDLKLLNKYQLCHNYEQNQRETTLYSENYNELKSTNKIKLLDETSEVIKYFAILGENTSLETRVVGKYQVYDYQSETSNLSICLLERDIEIGSKITLISEKEIYGRVVVINHITNKIKRIEI